MNKTTIDWPGLTHTWNPVVGCKRGCYYCYARKLHNKRHCAYMAGKTCIGKQYAEHFGVMQFFPDRLKIPKKSSVIKRVFVGSMTDIGYWKTEWVDAVLDVIRERPEIEFMFLTKNYWNVYFLNKTFPGNCWLGYTLTGDDSHNIPKGYFVPHLHLFMRSKSTYNKKFVSIEPILGDFNGINFTYADLVIVGAMTGKNAVVPRKEWIDSIKHKNLYYKNNIKKYLV